MRTFLWFGIIPILILLNVIMVYLLFITPPEPPTPTQLPTLGPQAVSPSEVPYDIIVQTQLQQTTIERNPNTGTDMQIEDVIVQEVLDNRNFSVLVSNNETAVVQTTPKTIITIVENYLVDSQQNIIGIDFTEGSADDLSRIEVGSKIRIQYSIPLSSSETIPLEKISIY